MFDCCRIPGLQGLDWSTSYAGFKADELGHITIVRRNRFWKLQGIVNGRILSMTELEKCVPPALLHVVKTNIHNRQIQYIYDSTTKEYPGVGVLTASNRDVWAKVHLIMLVLRDTF
jgi:carnitine O-acetyltransferase